MNHRLFVYGTLLGGQINAHLLAGAHRIGKAATVGAFELLHCMQLGDHGGFPGLRPGGSTSVKGQLYLVDDHRLARLDAFEGHPDLFRRAEIALAGGGRAQAYMVGNGKFASARVIPGGDWLRHVRRVALRLAGVHAGP
jgi:gamma-glutamylaminecyclotransferase